MHVVSRAGSAAAAGPGCERVADGLLREPVAALTSLSFVLAGLAVLLLLARRSATGPHAPGGIASGAGRRDLVGYAALVAGVGVGSFVQHGPDPAWSDVAHDLPLLATLAFLGADAVGDLRGRARAWWWWGVPVAALAPLVVLAPPAGDLAQVAVAAAAVAVTLRRAVARPVLRARIGTAVALLAVGATVGTLSRAGWPWCDPTSPWQGHGVWHVLAAVALAVLAPTVARGRPTLRRSGR